MGGTKPCCSKKDVNRGAWTDKEDKTLIDYIKIHGEGRWRRIPQEAGLKRCCKSCRLRWLNYLKPDIKRGNISPDEEDLIIRLHRLLGNRWSLIAGRLPGRTDNEIKNYWNTTLEKKLERSRSGSTSNLIKSEKNKDLMINSQSKEEASALPESMNRIVELDDDDIDMMIKNRDDVEKKNELEPVLDNWFDFTMDVNIEDLLYQNAYDINFNKLSGLEDSWIGINGSTGYNNDGSIISSSSLTNYTAFFDV